MVAPRPIKEGLLRGPISPHLSNEKLSASAPLTSSVPLGSGHRLRERATCPRLAVIPRRWRGDCGDGTGFHADRQTAPGEERNRRAGAIVHTALIVVFGVADASGQSV